MPIVVRCWFDERYRPLGFRFRRPPLHVAFDLDQTSMDFACPQCKFYNRVTYREARLGCPVICRGCKTTLKLDDAMGSLATARRGIMRAVSELQEIFGNFGR
jgi:hypothetical protein